jgi:hypothetical protein
LVAAAFVLPKDFRNALQELDGAFLSYGAGYASYLNPSIREFIASLISEDRDTAEDLLSSAIRFKQVANLWELSTVRPACELTASFASNPELLTQSLQRLLQGPSIRWEKSRDGLRGFPLDMGDEARIGFLVELSEAHKSAQPLRGIFLHNHVVWPQANRANLWKNESLRTRVVSCPTAR